MCHHHKSKYSGFTLLELSIVLVAIALIIGGIIVGQTLIRNAEVQSALKEYSTYAQAVGTFRDKYAALPGDFAGATALWGTASGGCPAGTGSDLQTCDGDGNGRIVTQGTSYATTYYEQFRAWQHLSDAQMIKGAYTGVVTSGTYNYTIGTNIPASALTGGGWKILTITTYDISSIPLTDIAFTTGDMPPNTVLWLGGAYFENSNRMSGILTPVEAYQIDVKLDDGLATTGKIISQSDSGMSACKSGTTYASTGSTATTKTCALVFKTSY